MQGRTGPIQKLARPIAGYFTYGVVTIATSAFLFWYFHRHSRVWSRFCFCVKRWAEHHRDRRNMRFTPSPLLLLAIPKLGCRARVLVIACPYCA
jgi:Cu2+-exporting ATPase